MSVDLSQLEVDQELASKHIDLTRADLVKYAGASGDFNPIHWNERFAREVGLPGVIAHGMLTMGAAVQLVTDWAGDPGAILDYQTRFTKPVPVADLEGGSIDVVATVGAIDEDNSTVRVDLAVTSDGTKVLMKAQAVVKSFA